MSSVKKSRALHPYHLPFYGTVCIDRSHRVIDMPIDLFVDWIICHSSVIVICDLSRDDHPGRPH